MDRRAPQLARELQTVPAWQLDIQQDQIRAQHLVQAERLQNLQRFLRALRNSDGVAGFLQQEAHQLGLQGVVFHYQDLDARHCSVLHIDRVPATRQKICAQLAVTLQFQWSVY